MTSQLEALEDWAVGLLGLLETAPRNKLTRSIGQALRRSQQKRIIAQRNPDGSRYAPRKQCNLRGKQGRVKRNAKMFQKLRRVRFLKAEGDGRSITVGFTGRAAKIARTHQFGLKDKAEKGAPSRNYHQRKILGLTNSELSAIRNSLLAGLA